MECFPPATPFRKTESPARNILQDRCPAPGYDRHRGCARRWHFRLPNRGTTIRSASFSGNPSATRYQQQGTRRGLGDVLAGGYLTVGTVRIIIRSAKHDSIVDRVENVLSPGMMEIAVASPTAPSAITASMASLYAAASSACIPPIEKPITPMVSISGCECKKSTPASTSSTSACPPH